MPGVLALGFEQASSVLRSQAVEREQSDARKAIGARGDEQPARFAGELLRVSAEPVGAGDVVEDEQGGLAAGEVPADALRGLLRVERFFGAHDAGERGETGREIGYVRGEEEDAAR